jgi:nucleotide-binding universal stress UspA family protein
MSETTVDGRTDDARAPFAARRPGRRVVVGVDGSPGSRRALEHALAEAVRRDADLEVVTAYPVQVYWMGSYAVATPDLDQWQRDTEERIRRSVQSALAGSGLELPEYRTHVVAEAGPPAAVLLQRAEDADLLVVGSRGRGGVRSALLGSVSLHCVGGGTECPVVVVHGTDGDRDASGGARVVVGVDGSEASRAALAEAAAQAARLGARLDLVAAYRSADYWTEAADALAPTVEEIRSAVEGQAQQMVTDLRAALADPGQGSMPETTVTVVEGAPADVLVQHARDADLLVVGSSGHGAVRKLLLGSVALHAVMHATCPVEVVHPQVGTRKRAPVPV